MLALVIAILMVLIIIMFLLFGLAARAGEIQSLIGQIELVEVSQTRYPDGSVESTLISKTKFTKNNTIPNDKD